MNIFHVLNESNENIMEYYSPPMQQMPMQQPMAFPSMGMMPQRPISMPTKTSEKKEKKDDDDDSTQDFLIKLLAVAGLGGGATLAYQHFNKPSMAQQIGGMGLDGAKFVAPIVQDYVSKKSQEHQELMNHAKDDNERDIITRYHQHKINEELPSWMPQMGKDTIGKMATGQNDIANMIVGQLAAAQQEPKPGIMQKIGDFFGGGR